MKTMIIVLCTGFLSACGQGHISQRKTDDSDEHQPEFALKRGRGKHTTAPAPNPCNQYADGKKLCAVPQRLVDGTVLGFQSDTTSLDFSLVDGRYVADVTWMYGTSLVENDTVWVKSPGIVSYDQANNTGVYPVDPNVTCVAYFGADIPDGLSADQVARLPGVMALPMYLRGCSGGCITYQWITYVAAPANLVVPGASSVFQECSLNANDRFGFKVARL